MKILLDDQDKIEIDFEYSFHPSGKSNKLVRHTVCTLKSETGTIATAQSIQHRDDPDVKKAARKAALTKALATARLNKARRAKIWNAYFALSKK